jgi:hypothetical protein
MIPAIVFFVTLGKQNIFVLLAAVSLTLSGCLAATSPKMTVLGVQSAARSGDGVVILQVTNPANRPLRVQKLEYTFAAKGGEPTSGVVSVLRDIPAGSTVVVEVPIDPYQVGVPVQLRGRLVTLLDQIVTSYPVNAMVSPVAK